MLTCDEYVVPQTLEQALRLMADGEISRRVVAGATDLLPWAREGRAGDQHIAQLIDLTKLPELRGYRVAEGRVHIGAATPLQRFLDSADLRNALPGMPPCAIWFADDQIRESATIGGNVVNASPAADCLPPLLAANAVIHMAGLAEGRAARHAMTLEDFLLGPGLTALGKDEILVAIEVDATPNHGGAFEKVGHRRSLVISVACLSGLVKLDQSGRRFEDVRLAIGGIGPIPKRMRDIEAALIGERVTADGIAAAARLGLDYVRSRSRVAYRRAIVPGLICRLLAEALNAAGAHPEASQAAREALHV